MKKVYRRSLKKIFVSLFAFFYTFLPYGFAIADVVNEFQGDNATPMEVVEEEIVEEQLPEEKIELEEPIINPEGEKLLKDTMSYPVWDLHGDTAITYENVELGKVYIAPQDSRVKLIFTKLPEVTSKLTIEKITLTQEEIDITGAISDVAYDITTDMENGTFEYDLELPSTEENVNIVYVEEREDIFTNLIPVENEIIQKKDTVKIKKVDHFTITIVTDPSPKLRTAWVNGQSQVSVLPGTNMVVTMKVELTGGSYWKATSYQIGNGAWVCIDTPDHTSNGTWTEEFHIEAPSSPGTYNLTLRAYSGSGWWGNDCTGDFGEKTLENAITVEPVPELEYNDSHPVALSSVTGIWTNVYNGSGHTGINTNEVKWGSGSTKSGLRFTKSGLQSFNTGGLFYLGMLTHINYPINAGSAADRATLQLTLNFDKPNIDSVSFKFDFDIEETSNSNMSSCKPYQWSLTPCDDRITFPTKYGDGVSFLIGVTKYTLVIEGFVNVFPGGFPVDEFITEESKESSALLIGRLTSELVQKPAISIEKKTKDIFVEKEGDAPVLFVGDNVEWQYVVQNTGNVELTDIVVTDDKVDTIICPSDSDTLPASDIDEERIMICRASGIVTEGLYKNIATVTGKAPDNTEVTDEDPSWYRGVYPGYIEIVKKTTGGDGIFTFDSNFGITSLTTENGTKSKTSERLIPGGTYYISETDIPEGWEFDKVECDRGTNEAIGVVSGETTTCTFHNKAKTGTLIIEKVLINDNGGTKNFTDFSFKIDGGSDVSFDSDGQNEIIVDAGIYNIIENEVSGYAVSYENCSNVEVPSGGTAICKITNNDIAPTLKILKEAINDNGGTATISDFGITLTDTTLSFGAGSTVDKVTTYEANPTVVSNKEYTLAETGATGYTQESLECLDGENDLGSTFTLNPGQNVICKIVNNDIAPKLTLNKIVSNTHGGQKGESDWTLYAKQGDVIALSGQGASGDVDVVSGNTFQAGTYTLSETGPNGYTASNWSCAGGSLSGSNITLEVGQEAVCSITNSDNAAGLTVVKNVVNDNGGNVTIGDFGIELNNNALTFGDGAISGSTTTYTSTPSVKSNTEYTLTEIDHPGYEEGTWSCVDNNGGTVNHPVTLSEGQSVTCTITNNDIQPKITVTKIVEGGKKKVSDFNLYVGETEVISGVQIGFNAGTYTVREDVDTDYNSVITGACDKNGSITLALGDTKECTITNTRKTGQISFVKNITYGDALPSNWVFAVYKGDELVGTYDHEGLATLDTGEYTVQEIGPTPSLPYYLDSIGGTACTGTISSGIADLTVTESGGTCVFGNSKKPTITVKKLIEPTNSQDTFEFTVNGETFTLGHSDTEIVDVMPGSYTIAEAGTAGYRTEILCDGDIDPTLATMRTISLKAGDNKLCTFTNTKLASISGTKWNDVNGNGEYDGEELPVQGVQICIDANINGVCDTGEVSVATDASGNYTFSNLLPDTYNIIETLNSGWEQTYPKGSHTVELSAGEEKTDYNFGNWELKPGIKVEKSSDTEEITTVNQVVPYTFTVTNTGNQTLTGITVTDPRCASAPAYISGDTNNDSKLQTSETWSYICDYTVQQSDIDTGDKLSNKVTANSTQVGPVEDTLDIPITKSPDMSVTKKADVESVNASGQVITYTIEVFNKGNTTLTNVSVEDLLLSNLDCDGTAGSPYTTSGFTINVGSSLTCTGTYTVTQDDIDSKDKILNTVTADNTATGPKTANEEVDVVKNPGMTVKKSSTTTSLSSPQTVSYSYLVTNTGNTTLTGITLSDDNDNDDMTCPKNTLQVDEDMICTATHTFTQAELDTGGTLDNVVTGINDQMKEDVTDNLSIPIKHTPGIGLVKSGSWVDGNEDEFANVGETISYTFTVTNKGNITLTGITVKDPLLGGTIVSCSRDTLPVGESTTCTAIYPVTQDDIDKGKVDNKAGVSCRENISAYDDETVNLPQNPKLSIEKTGVFDSGSDNIANPGDLITYTFNVTNIGNITLTGITVTDPLLGGALVSCSRDTLLVGGSTTCTATYPVTQDDIDAGEVKNTATADSDESDEVTDDAIVELPQKPGLSIDKSATSSTYSKVGDIITYTFTITNTGNITLSNISVEDSLVGLGDITCGDTSQGLAPNNTVICEAQYKITLDDLDNGKVVNSAYAKDDKETMSNPDEETVTSIAGKITIQKYIHSEQAYEQEFEFEPSWTENFFLTAGQSKESDWLIPGTYSITEIVPTGWILAGMECGEKEEIYTVRNSINTVEEGNITLGDNGNILCTFTNEVISPLLEITKKNDTGGAGMYPGDTVTYTLTITTPNDEKEGTYILNNIIVTDLLPEGFTYIPGSWTGTTTEPVYNNGLGEWHIGEMLEGETITLTYKALISLLQEPGIYPDIAWTKGTSLSDTEVLGNVSTGADTPYVGTEVLVIGEYDIEEGEVLGVSTTTTLPVTGANKYITIGALILSLLGLLLIIFKPSKKTKLLLTVGIVAMGILTFVKPNIAYAEGGLSTSLNVRIAQPETKLNKDTFNIGYVVLDTEGRNLEVKCIEKTYGVFDTLNTNSGSCKVNSSVITESGTYKFYVEVTAGGETEKSKTVTVEVDLSKPLPITDYSKTLGTCSYTLTFNSSTSKVQIFRSDNQKSFFANDTTLITKPHLTVTPNSIATYTDSNLTDCTKTYYYAVRSIDEFNNVSPLVTDEIVTTIPASTTPSTTTATQSSTVTPVAITDEIEEGEAVKEEKGSEIDEEAQVKGEEDTDKKESQTEKEDEKDTDESFWSKYKYVILAIIVVALAGGTYTYVKREK